MNDAPLARFDFRSGLQRGSTLTLYPDALVHRGAWTLEAMPLSGIAAVRVSFDRNANMIGWGITLLIVALVLWLLASPLAGLAGGAADELRAHMGNDSSAGRGVAAALLTLFRVLQAIANFLPVLAALLALGGAALGALGWWGRTTLVVTLSAAERVYGVLGRDTVLLEFSEIVGNQVVQKRR